MVLLQPGQMRLSSTTRKRAVSHVDYNLWPDMKHKRHSWTLVLLAYRFHLQEESRRPPTRSPEVPTPTASPFPQNTAARWSYAVLISLLAHSWACLSRQSAADQVQDLVFPSRSWSSCRTWYPFVSGRPRDQHHFCLPGFATRWNQASFGTLHLVVADRCMQA